MGVYGQVAQINPKLKQINLAFINTPLDNTSFYDQYNFENVNFGRHYDFVWLTKQTIRSEDRCKKFLQRKHQTVK